MNFRTPEVNFAESIHQIMNQHYIPALRHEIIEIINEKKPILLVDEKLKYLNLLMEIQRSGHECHKEISDVIKDLHKAYGYTGA